MTFVLQYGKWIMRFNPSRILKTIWTSSVEFDHFHNRCCPFIETEKQLKDRYKLSTLKYWVELNLPLWMMAVRLWTASPRGPAAMKKAWVKQCAAPNLIHKFGFPLDYPKKCECTHPSITKSTSKLLSKTVSYLFMKLEGYKSGCVSIISRFCFAAAPAVC